MNYAVLGYNNSIRSTINFTLFQQTFGRTLSRNPNGIFLPYIFYSKYPKSQFEKIVSKRNDKK